MRFREISERVGDGTEDGRQRADGDRSEDREDGDGQIPDEPFAAAEQHPRERETEDRFGCEHECTRIREHLIAAGPSRGTEHDTLGDEGRGQDRHRDRPRRPVPVTPRGSGEAERGAGEQRDRTPDRRRVEAPIARNPSPRTPLRT